MQKGWSRREQGRDPERRAELCVLGGGLITGKVWVWGIQELKGQR